MPCCYGQHDFVHYAYVELACVEGDMSSILWLGNASVEGTGYHCVCLLKVDGIRLRLLAQGGRKYEILACFIDPAVWLQRAVNSCYLLPHYFDSISWFLNVPPNLSIDFWGKSLCLQHASMRCHGTA